MIEEEEIHLDPNQLDMFEILVIWDQEYDMVSILDVITRDKLNDYVESFKKRLFREGYEEILETKYYNQSYGFKVKKDKLESWQGFIYSVFPSVNDFENRN